MENKITPEQALTNLYLASRRAPLAADDHATLEECARIISEALKPKEEEKKEE